VGTLAGWLLFVPVPSMQVGIMRMLMDEVRASVRVIVRLAGWISRLKLYAAVTQNDTQMLILRENRTANLSQICPIVLEKWGE
jgi:hypothetical protein